MRAATPTCVAPLHGSHELMVSLEFIHASVEGMRHDFPMRPVKLIALGLLLLPLAELIAFVLVARLIGLANAFVLLILTSLTGVLALRSAGQDAVTRLRAATGQVEVRDINLDGRRIAAALGAILLIVPGFITAAQGLMLVFPRTRQWLLAGIRRLLTPGRSSEGPRVIDLEPEEWRDLPPPNLRPRRRRSEP
jgi:UPF0716 protein FxsA